jgi:hypothetical protein
MTININGGSLTQYISGYNSISNPFAYTTQYTTTTGGSTTTATIKDASITTTVTPTATVNNIIYCNYPITSVTNNTTSVCSTSAFTANVTSFNITTLTSGTGQIVLNTSYGALASNFNCFVGSTYTNSYLANYTTGSLAKTINTLIVNAVGSYTTPDSSFMNVYSSGFTRNTNLYTKNIIDLSPFTDNGYSFSCSLISPRHIVYPTHAAIGVGTSITFTDKNGGTQTKTVTVVTRNINGTTNSDIGVGYLDSAVTGITPYSVLPANATATLKLPLSSESTGAYNLLPQGIYGFVCKVRYPFGYGDVSVRQMMLGVIKNTEGSLTTPDTSGGAGVSSPTANRISQTSDVRYPYTNWCSNIANGDSGSPTFLPTGLTTATGTPLTLLLGVQSTGGVAASISYYITEINTAMNAIKDPGDTTTYALDVISTSQSSWWNSFTTY